MLTTRPDGKESAVKQLIRQSIERMPAPLPLWVQNTFRYLRYPQVRRRERACRRILTRLERPGQVAQGPFLGMRYVSAAYHSQVLPKLLGTYECELFPALESLCRA